ncbi:MAG: hypothetical protein JSV43_04950 [Methanobacteriota archaeon]|nr:MAG: hypothetical protein JSV43_04950 [Euryarchaeota archaeon]
MKGQRTSFYILSTFVFLALFASSANAHVPNFTGGGDSPETAGHIHDPLKSWVIYDELHEGGEGHYYSLHMEEGERLRLQLFTPEENFVPGLVVMGPGIENHGTVPSYIEVPDGANATVLEGELKDGAEYEPFTPASYYYTVDFDGEVTSSGDYYLAVYEPSRGGRYGIAVGYLEQFSLQEWLSVPFDAIRIHEWEGQNVVLILAPMIATLLVGLIILIWPFGNGRLTQKTEIWRVLGTFAGLLYLGSGFMLLVQMGIALSLSGLTAAAAVTLIFIMIPVLLGFLLIRKVIRKKSELTVLGRVTFLILGFVGLFLWTGLIIGPILAVVAGLLPSRLALVSSEVTEEENDHEEEDGQGDSADMR